MPKIPKRTLALLAILMIATLYNLIQKQSRDDPALAGTELIPAPGLADFELTDVFGKPFKKTDVLGKWTVLTFGLTHCPDICPLSLASFRDELLALPLNSRNRIQFVFVSVDPHRDTPERLKSFVHSFHTAIKPVSGTEAQLRHFVGLLHADFSKQATADLYTVSHSPQFFVINPQGQWQVLYSPPLAKGRLAEDLKALSRPKRFGIF